MESYLMELTPSGTYTMEVEHTPWKLPHGNSYIPWKVPNGTYTMEVTSWNIHHGSYLTEQFNMEVTSWNLHHGSNLHVGYIVEHHGSYLMELTFIGNLYTMDVTS